PAPGDPVQPGGGRPPVGGEVPGRARSHGGPGRPGGHGVSTVFQTSQEAFEWLRSQIAVVKAGDPLAPATVLVANHYVGLVLRRRLAEAGYVNVRFSVLGQVAEPLAAPRLALRGYSPLS